MKIMFLGADHEVTGSCHYMELCGKHLLIDCGMEQGKDIYENQEIPVSPSDLDYILLTHAHIDHSGLIPLMYAKGFRGRVVATSPTVDLCNIMLRDSAHIQEFEAEWRNRKAKRSGKEEYVPLYTMDDAIGALSLFEGAAYEQRIKLCEGVEVRFSDVGHLLGSASIEIWASEPDQNGSIITKKIAFSGDIGNYDQPIIKDPKYIKHADYVVMESTYGDRYHGERPDYVARLTEIIQRTFERGGNLVIPSFAVGRTQEMLYFLRKIKTENMVKGFENFEVYVDSPLAIEATSIFNKNVDTCFDEDAMELVRQGINPISFPGLKLSVTSNDSKLINMDTKPKVILSASGMCEAGRIRHHLKHNLWRRECTILFVGYQAVGTLGRALLDGTKSVTLFGEEIHVQAEIMKLDGVSGHADKEGLLRWVNYFEEKPAKVFVVHGEDHVCDNFVECLKQEHGHNAEAPYSGSEYDLIQGCWIKTEEGVRIAEVKKKKESSRRANDVFMRLLAAGQRLMTVIRHNEGGANKDLAKFADQINNLCNKWER